LRPAVGLAEGASSVLLGLALVGGGVSDAGAVVLGEGAAVVPSAGELGAPLVAGAVVASAGVAVLFAGLGVGLAAAGAPADEDGLVAGCVDAGAGAGAEVAAVGGVAVAEVDGAGESAGVLVVLEGVDEPDGVASGVCADAGGLLVPAPSPPKP
jgi:hypothetical protein